MSAVGSGLSAGSAGSGVSTARITRIRAGLPLVSACVGVLALTAALVLTVSDADSSRAWLPPLHDRRPVTVVLLVVAAVGWEFILTLAAVRVVQARRIMRRHRLEKLATARSVTGPDGPDVPGSSLD